MLKFISLPFRSKPPRRSADDAYWREMQAIELARLAEEIRHMERALRYLAEDKGLTNVKTAKHRAAEALAQLKELRNRIRV